MGRFVYLVRHGETDWNAEGRWQGQSDIPLNAVGRVQARGAGEVLRAAGPLAGLVSSDLSRARDTARIAGEVLGLSLEYMDPDLRERTFGIFEGLTRAECEARHPGAWRAWIENLTPPVGGESREELALRVTAGIGLAVERVARPELPVVIVTHGGSLRAAIGVATGETPPPIGNGAIWRIEWTGGIVAAQAFAPPAPPAI